MHTCPLLPLWKINNITTMLEVLGSSVSKHVITVAPQAVNLALSSSAGGCCGISPPPIPPIHMCCKLAPWQQPWRRPPVDMSSQAFTRQSDRSGSVCIQLGAERHGRHNREGSCPSHVFPFRTHTHTHTLPDNICSPQWHLHLLNDWTFNS